MSGDQGGGGEREWETFTSVYCESCGQLFEASDEIRGAVKEPVHRVELIEAIGPLEEVAETTAEELRKCEDCGGQVVKRWYIYPASNVPEVDYEPDPEEISGRDPDEDALIDFGPIGGEVQEVREVSWIAEGSETGDNEDTETSHPEDSP